MIAETRLTAEGPCLFGWLAIRSPRLRSQGSFRFRRWLVGILAGACCISAACAGEELSLTSFEPAPLLAFGLPTFSPAPQTNSLTTPFTLGSFRTAPAAWILGAESELTTGLQNFFDYSLKSWRKRSYSQSYSLFNTLRPGIGEMLPNDIVGRSRANGAGVQDATCLYVKMIFRF